MKILFHVAFLLLSECVFAQVIQVPATLGVMVQTDCFDEECAAGRALIDEALLEETRGNQAAAINLLIKASLSDSSSACALKHLGRIRLAQKQYAGAVKYLNDAAAQRPDDDQLKQWTGQAYFGLGEIEAAARSFAGIRDIESAAGDALLDYSAVLDRQRRCERAFAIAVLAYDDRHLKLSADFPARLRLLHKNCHEYSKAAAREYLNDVDLARQATNGYTQQVIIRELWDSAARPLD